MSSSSRIARVCIALIAVFVLAGTWWWRNANIRTRIILLEAEESFKRDADEKIPSGSTRAEVERYLRSRDMVYADRDLARMSTAESKTQALSQIEARTTREIRAPIGSCFILAYFNFDPSDKLVMTKYKTTCKSIL